MFRPPVPEAQDLSRALLQTSLPSAEMAPTEGEAVRKVIEHAHRSRLSGNDKG